MIHTFVLAHKYIQTTCNAEGGLESSQRKAGA